MTVNSGNKLGGRGADGPVCVWVIEGGWGSSRATEPGSGEPRIERWVEVF